MKSVQEYEKRCHLRVIDFFLTPSAPRIRKAGSTDGILSRCLNRRRPFCPTRSAGVHCITSMAMQSCIFLNVKGMKILFCSPILLASYSFVNMGGTVQTETQGTFPILRGSLSRRNRGDFEDSDDISRTSRDGEAARREFIRETQAAVTARNYRNLSDECR